MHEMALAESVLGIVEDTARRHAASRVTGIRLEIGALSHVDPEALRFCLDAVAKSTLAAAASVDILRTPGAAWCMPCGKRVPLARLGEGCPDCGSHQLEVVEGCEMRVKDIEIA